MLKQNGTRCLLLLLFVLLCSFSVQAQLYTGTLTGTVTDPSGGVVPNAKVVVTDVSRGFTYNGVTDEQGRFVIRSLPPSTYRVSVDASGFRPFSQENVTLNVNQNATLDVPLTVAGAEQSVQVVESGAPVLQTQDASTGQAINRTFINDLPLVGRNVFDLARLAPGVSEPRGNGGWSNNFISQGSRNATADVLLDGVSTVAAEQNGNFQMPLYQPSVDAVQEFTVQQSGFSAEFGFTGSTVVNVVTRSGTNELHGSLFEFVRNEKFNAQNFFAAGAGLKKPAMRWNQFGGTIGGPIVKDRLFFFADYQGTRERRGQTWRAGVPSAAMRAGDFGEICPQGFNAEGRCNNADNQLWDPWVATFDTGQDGPVRSRFIPFNNLGAYASSANPQGRTGPGNLIDPVGRRIMNFFPLPNYNVGTSTYNRFNNWIGTGSNRSTGDQVDAKIDFRVSDADFLSGKFAYGRSNYANANCFPNAFDPCSVGPGIGGPRLGSLNWTHTFNPTTLATVSFGTTRSYQDRPGVGADYPDFDIVRDLGFPSYMTASGLNTTPVIYLNNYQPVSGQNFGGQGWGIMRYASEVHHLIGNLSKIAGRHELKFGAETRLHRINFRQAGTPTGVHIFQNNSTSREPWSGGGDPMAGLLIGYPGPNNQWGGYEMPLFTSTSAWKYAGFVQDNWRATDKLTVNLGVRYDIEMPRTERFNRMSYVDLDAPAAIQVPGLDLRGAIGFVDENNRTQYNTDRNNIAPRFGFAYQATQRTVVRGGYGIFYLPSAVGAAGTGAGGFLGFQETTPWLTGDPRIPQSPVPFATLSNPYPLGINPPLPRSALNNSYFIGRGISGPIRTWNTNPYEQTWNFNVQRELPWATVVEAAYIGKKGTKLFWGGNVTDANYLPANIAQDIRAGKAAFWNETVPNPFYGIITDPNSGLAAERIARSQLYRPFPQYSGVSGNAPPWAGSIYHALQLRFEKRLSSGLQFLTTYVFSKSIDDTSSSGSNTNWLGNMSADVQDLHNRRLERSVSLFDQTHQFQFSWVWQLPFGKGRLFGNAAPGPVEAILGGWQLNGSYRYTSGFPIALSLQNASGVNGTQRPNITGPLEKNPNWQNDMQYFANAGQVLNRPAQYQVGTASRSLSNIRWPGVNNWTGSLFKQFNMARIREGMLFEVRLESFNVLNTPQFCGPVSEFGNGQFGQINAQCNDPRQVQLGGKFYF